MVRLKVLKDSINLKGFATFWLSIYLDIDSRASKSLGNKSTSLSLNNKVNLLIDLGALDRKESDQFLRFMEIRNQFMHNPAAKSFIDCFKYISGIEQWLKKKFKVNTKLTQEEQFESYYEQLAKNVLSNAASIFNTAREKITQREEVDRNQKMIDFVHSNLPELLTIMEKSKITKTNKEKINSFRRTMQDLILYVPPTKEYH